MSKKAVLNVVAGTPDRPLVIGDIEIQCYVLEDETRALSQGGFLTAIGRSRTPKAGMGGMSNVDELPFFLRTEQLKPFISNELRESTKPIIFHLPSGQKTVDYNALLLPKVCEVYLQARDAGALLASQKHIAERAEILIRGLATVGIIALVDEATGYQEIRDRQALHKILDAYLLSEHAKWARRFPDEFYWQIFRLRGWQWQGMKVNRPSVVGRYTNDIVWDRLAPGIRMELEQWNPKNEIGRRLVRHHQYLTDDIGYPAAGPSQRRDRPYCARLRDGTASSGIYKGPIPS